MDNLNIAAEENIGFFKHVFNFDEESKGEMLNIIQYCVMAFIPIILATRNINYFFPAIDSSKGDMELIIEALGQLAVTFIVLLIINRIITYFSTWSGVPQSSLNFPSLIILFLFLSFAWNQGKEGKKLEIVLNRLLPMDNTNFWDTNNVKPASAFLKSASVVKITQPLSKLPPPIATKKPSVTDYTAMHQVINTPTQVSSLAYQPSINKQKDQAKLPLEEILPQLSGVAPKGGQYGEFCNPCAVGGSTGVASIGGASIGGGNAANGVSSSNFEVFQGSPQEPMAANEALGGFSAY